MLLAISLPMSLLLAVTPRLRQRREVARRAARLFLLAIASPLRIAGAAADAHYPCVVVANHASYLDGIILTAALPAGFLLVKREMASVPVAGFIPRDSAPRSWHDDLLTASESPARSSVSP
jgi:1-acyl-sn-glycerol-3-phosphate acyltransferase